MPAPLSAEDEARFLKMAEENPEMTCGEAPVELLELASSEAEPTPFMEEYFAVGHAEFLAVKHGRRINLPKNLMDRAILVLWTRAGILHTAHIMGQESPDANVGFFDDEGLY